MTVISDSIRSVSGVPDDRQITFACSVLRDSDGGDAIVSTRFENVTPVDGEFTVDLDPGPAEVVIRNQKYVFVVPESGPSRLWPLIESYVPVVAPVVNAAVAARDAAVAAKDAAETILDQVEAGVVPDDVVSRQKLAPAVRTELDGYITQAEADARVTAVGDNTYAPVFADATTITYSGGNVASVTENGVTTTFTYNPDGTVATDTRAGVTRTYTYDGSGNLTGIAS